MTEVRRTEIHAQPWRYCFDCRNETLVEELVTRPRIISWTEGTIQHPFSFFASRSQSDTYKLVDVCIQCEALAIQDRRRLMIERSVGLGSLGLILFGYWQVVIAGITGWFGVKMYRRYGWRIKRRYHQLRLAWKGKY